MTTAARPLLSPSRRRRCDQLDQMDADADHQRIVRITGTLEFPWDMKRALELALFRTFAVPRISGLLARTGEFARRPQRRYDDTTILIAEFVEHGYDSPRGRAAIERMNSLHGRYRIRDEDFLYVLSTFVFEPSRWIDQYGWRPLTATERRAGFVFWREVADRMRIRDAEGVLADVDRFDAWRRAYEQAELRYAPCNATVASATRELFLVRYVPRHLRGMGVRAVHALLDDALLDAFGFPPPTPVERRAVRGALRARARGQRHLPARRRPVLETARRHPTYPHGYGISELGPA